MRKPLELGNLLLPSTIRVPDELYENLREIRLSLESRHQSAAPTIQDLVSVSLKRLIRSWESPDERNSLLQELLEHREDARLRMGKKIHND